MTKNQLRRIAAIGGSLAVMAVGGGYAAGAFAHGGHPARAAQVRISPAAHQHLGKDAAAALASRRMDLRTLLAAAEDQSDDQGENADDQGDGQSDSSDQGDQDGDQQGDSSENNTDGDSGSDNGDDAGDNGD